MFNDRYRQWLEQNGGEVECRRRLAEYAEAHGTRAAMARSGASKVTVNRLRRQEREARAAGAAGAGFRGPGRPPVSADDEERIVAARLEHPDYGPRRLKKHCGIPTAEPVIWAVLRRQANAGSPAAGSRRQQPQPVLYHISTTRYHAPIPLSVNEFSISASLNLGRDPSLTI